MIKKIYLNKKIVSKSNNLRGIINYSRNIGLDSVYISDKEGKKNVFLIFKNGATSFIKFEDTGIALKFFKKRIGNQKEINLDHTTILQGE
jgi:hypothetical protein